MTEFEFLDKQFRRLSEARGLRHKDEQSIPVDKKGKRVAFSAYEAAELMIAGSICDYLKLRAED
jgi:hypothetical protein